MQTVDSQYLQIIGLFLLQGDDYYRECWAASNCGTNPAESSNNTKHPDTLYQVKILDGRYCSWLLSEIGMRDRMSPYSQNVSQVQVSLISCSLSRYTIEFQTSRIRLILRFECKLRSWKRWGESSSLIFAKRSHQISIHKYAANFVCSGISGAQSWCK